MRGYLDDSADPAQPYAAITGVPYGVYDIILYVDNDTGAADAEYGKCAMFRGLSERDIRTRGYA